MSELEARLRALAADVQWPETPDLRAAVLRAPAPRRRSRRLLALVVAALVLVPAAGAVALPGARDDVLEFLGLRDVKVQRQQAPPPNARPELEDDLGRVVSMAEARRVAGFAPLVPAVLGRPDRVRVTAQRISLVYDDPRIFLTEVRGGIDGGYLQKLLYGNTQVRRVRVSGHVGAFISGGEHGYLYVTPGGNVVEDRPLLAGPTLIWEQEGLVLRLEGRFGRKKALQMAESITR
jgi:hypothetical protein